MTLFLEATYLEGADLDLWTARACGMDRENGYGLAFITAGDPDRPGKPRCVIAHRNWAGSRVFAPTRKWSDAGPLLERHKLELFHFGHDLAGEEWSAWAKEIRASGKGSTPLIALCRALVSMAYGEEAADRMTPEQLKSFQEKLGVDQ